MRASTVVQSSMPTGKAWLGWWGDMGGPRQKGIISYSLAPNQQRAFKGVLSGYLFNGYRRLASQAPYFILPFGVAYGIYRWAKERDEYYTSKAALAAGQGGH